MAKKINISAPIILFLLLICYPTFSNWISDDSSKIVKPPVLMDPNVDLYQAGDIYLGGQPKTETLDTLLSLGLTLVINIRTEQEIATQIFEGYDEESYAKEIGLEYVHIPIGGATGYTPEAIAEIENSINDTNGKILIHCRSAGRATLAWMAWLVRFKDYSIDDAVKLGKMVKFTFPLEELLGYPISMHKEE